MMKFNIRKKNFNIMTQKTSVMTSPHHMTRWWKWRVHYSDLSVSFSWLIMSGNEGITVKGGGSKASPPLGHRKQKKNPVWIGLSLLCSPSPIRNEVSPGEDTRLRSNFPCGCFVKVAQCHRVRFCHLHALNRMKGTAKIKMGFMLKLMQY